LKRFEEAEKALREATRITKKSANAHYLFGFLLSQQQKWGASVKELQEADFQSPNHPEILRCLGWSYHNQNRKSAQGIALIERSRTLSPNDPNILCDLGVCYMNSQQHERAQQIFRRVIEIAPNSNQARECQNFLKILDQSDSSGK
jgi:tetratricopeptide (TPR) repeat protein